MNLKFLILCHLEMELKDFFYLLREILTSIQLKEKKKQQVLKEKKINTPT